MDASLQAVKDCVQHLHSEADVDEPILQYIQQLIEQAVQDGDSSELRDCLDACFPAGTSAQVDEAVNKLMSSFGGVSNNHQLESSSRPASQAQITTSSSSRKASNSSARTNEAFFFANASNITDECSISSTQARSTSASGNATSSSSATADSTVVSNAFPGGSSPTQNRSMATKMLPSLNPNACAFVPRQPSQPPRNSPELQSAHGHLRDYILPATVPGSVDSSPVHQHEYSSQPTVAHMSDSWQGPSLHKGLGAIATDSADARASERADGLMDIRSTGFLDTSAAADEDWSFTPGADIQDGREIDAEVLEWDMTAQETEAQFLQDAGWGWDDASQCTGDQAVAILSNWFPTYSVPVLTDVLEANHGSLAKTYAELSTLELDISNSSQIVRESSGSSFTNDGPVSNHTPSNLSVTPPALDDHHFPSLTSSSPSSSQGTPPLYSQSWGSHQRRAKSFAGALQTAPSRSPPTFSSTPPTALKSHTPQHRTSGKAAAVAVPWVSTGEEVAAQYAAAREEARDHARLRNMCFQQATLAYLSGNKALAKELSLRGRHHSDLMKECHERACHGIFSTRNAHLTSSSEAAGGREGAKAGPANFVDLHGMHVSEARSMLDKLLAGAKQGRKGSRTQQAFLVCVGTGHHTKVQHARLPQAVEAYLKEKGFVYSYAQPGLIRVVL